MHYCKKCGKEIGFISAQDRHIDMSTSILFDVIADKPTIVIKKIYQCSWCGTKITTTTILEEVGYFTEDGAKPLQFNDIFNKKNEG